MDETAFWALMDGAKAEAREQQADQAEILQKKLQTLPAEEIIAFDRIFNILFFNAYRWDLLAAARIIGGGCGDDGFMDFRAGLIGLGREAYYDAVNDPNSLALQPQTGVDFFYEELAYAAHRAYETVTGEEEIPDDGARHPREPAGEPWDEATVAEKYPRLATKFGWDISNE
jgi:hypothetical protein